MAPQAEHPAIRRSKIAEHLLRHLEAYLPLSTWASEALFELAQLHDIPLLSDDDLMAAAMRELKGRTLESGKEVVADYRQVDGGPTATNIRFGNVAGLLGFNADWRWEDDRHVLFLSYTGLWHGRGEPPQGMERGPFGYPDNYQLHEVTTDAGVICHDD